jgi:hypothetical protein
MKEDEVGRACSTSGRRNMHTGYWRENFTSRENLEEQGMDDKTKFKRKVQK